jgi:hypothetical protein
VTELLSVNVIAATRADIPVASNATIARHENSPTNSPIEISAAKPPIIVSQGRSYRYVTNLTIEFYSEKLRFPMMEMPPFDWG